ncbi:MAG: glycosyl transferase, group 1 [uncultured bacterium]|nr:MAG: glycosyl transferase, group 1 [uncultured bacterium]
MLFIKSMNILILKNPYESQGFGGGEVHTMQVANFLRKCGHKVYFAGSCKYLLKSAKKDKFEVERINFAGTEAVTEFAILKFLFQWPFIKKRYLDFLKRYRKEKKINVLYILSWNEKFLLAPIAKKLGMKIIFVEHRLLERFIKSNPFKNWYVKGTRDATVIAVSNAVKRGLLELGVDDENIEVVYNGVDLEEFRGARSVSNKDEHSIKIGTIGRLSEDKGIEYLIDAAEIVLKKDINVEFEIAGEGPLYESLKVKIEKLKRQNKIRLLGRLSRKNVIIFLDSLDLFVLAPTHGEAFGIVLAEAGAMNLPSVVTDVGGTPEVVWDGKTGFVVPAKDSRAIADALIRLIQSRALRIKMGNAARERIEKKFDLSKMLNSIKRIVTDDS